MVKHYEPFTDYKEANINVGDLRTMKFEVDARIAELTAESYRYRADAEYMQWIADNAEVVTTGQGMRVVLVLTVFGNNNWSIRDYLSMEINGTMHDFAHSALRERE
jgi:hypothetical protein